SGCVIRHWKASTSLQSEQNAALAKIDYDRFAVFEASLSGLLLGEYLWLAPRDDLPDGGPRLQPFRRFDGDGHLVAPRAPLQHNGDAGRGQQHGEHRDDKGA